MFSATFSNGFVTDALALVEAIQITLGGKSVQSSTNSRYIQRQLLYTMPKKKLMKYARGLGIKLDDDYNGDNVFD